MDKQLIFPMEEKFQEYLIDESRLKGHATSISFPESEEEIKKIIKEIEKEKNVGITIQGGKTGIVGGAVPMGGHILNMSGMKKCKSHEVLEDGRGKITVEAGLSLMELNSEINRTFKGTSMIWPPQPTETSAAIGGILASGAKGINGCYYGDSGQYVEKIRMVSGDGTVKEITREKNKEELDLILGGEGIFGIITEAELILLPQSPTIWGISFFFESRKDVGKFAIELEKMKLPENADILALEYIDRLAMDLLEAKKSTMTKVREVPDVPGKFDSMIYLEIAGEEEPVETLAEMVMELAEECNSDSEEAWAVSGESEVEKMRAYRHGVAESVNLSIEEARRQEERITKLGTDMVIGNRTLEDVIAMYQNDMMKESIEGCIFGHIKGNHLHVNLLPQNYEEYVKGKALLQDWAKNVEQEGGSKVVEHGIGKLKHYLNPNAIDWKRENALRTLKETYDKKNLFNPGNIWNEAERL